MAHVGHLAERLLPLLEPAGDGRGIDHGGIREDRPGYDWQGPAEDGAPRPPPIQSK